MCHGHNLSGKDVCNNHKVDRSNQEKTKTVNHESFVQVQVECAEGQGNQRHRVTNPTPCRRGMQLVEDEEQDDTLAARINAQNN